MECGHLVLRWWTSPCDHDWASWDWIMGGLQWLQMHLLWESVNILLRRIMEPASPIMILWGMCHPVHGSPSSGTCIFIYNQEMHLLWVFPTARWLKLWQLRPFLALDYVLCVLWKVWDHFLTGWQSRGSLSSEKIAVLRKISWKMESTIILSCIIMVFLSA